MRPKRGQKGKRNAPRRTQTTLAVRNPMFPTANTITAVTSPDIIESVCGLFDAFCPAAVGRRIPRQFGVATSTYQGRAIIPLASGAANKCFIFNFSICADSYNYGLVQPASDTAGAVFTGTTQAFPGWASIVSSYTTQARVVSAGVRFIPTAPSTTAAGYMQIGEVPAYGANNISIIAGRLSDYAQKVQTTDCRKEWTWLASPSSDVYSDFVIPQTVATPGATSQNDNWLSLIGIGVTPAVATSVGYLEFVVNYEYVPLAVAATPAINQSSSADNTPAAGLVKVATDAVRTTTQHIFQATTDTVSAVVYQAAKTALRRAAGALNPSAGAMLALADRASQMRLTNG